jgi:hypothetical protein
MIESQAACHTAETVDCSTAEQTTAAPKLQTPGAERPEPFVRPLATSLAIIGSLVRLVPHPWNLSPSYAVELFAGARMRAWQALSLALIARAVTDVAIFLTPFRGQEDSASYYLSFMPWVYLSVILNVCLGRLVRNTETAWKIGGVTLLATLQFFIVTNFGSWLGSPLYPKTLAGLIQCYVAALPWLTPTLISYVVFVPVFFGLHAVLSRSLFPRERVVPASV